MLKKYPAVAVVIVMILAAVIRIWGIKWGLPSDLHFYSYHPDENMVLGAANRVNILFGQFDPGFYNYGSLYIFLVSISVIISAMCGLVNLAAVDLSTNISQVANMYLAGRTVAVLMGITTVYFVYLLGKKAYGRSAGILAAVFMAILPLHVMHSRFMAVDVPSTFFVTLTLLFAVRISDGHRLRDYIFAGLFAGFAAGTKYNAGLVLIAPIIIHLLTGKARPLLRIIDPKMFGMILCTAIGFVIGTPGVFLNTPQFIHDFTYEMGHARAGHGLVFAGTGSGFVYHFMHSLLPGMGLPLLVLAMIGVIYALRKRTSTDIALAAFLIVYYIMIGMAQVRFARYTIPFLPVLVLFAARFTVNLLDRLSSGKPAAKFAGYLVGIIVLLSIGYTTLYSFSLDNMMATVDTRDRSINWIRDNISRGSTIGLPTIPWFYTPPFEPDMGLSPIAGERLEQARDFSDYLLVVNGDREWDADYLTQESPDYVIISEFESVDRLRIKDESAFKYMKVLSDNYQVIREFSGSPSLFGYSVPLFAKLPHDMSYVSPDVTIYGRKGVD
ncbi:MAG: ArnT family glycosyltransferase [Armatimonadota bacterium]